MKQMLVTPEDKNSSFPEMKASRKQYIVGFRRCTVYMWFKKVAHRNTNIYTFTVES